MAGNNIPEDIIVEILSKLPVKSLLRFRCVSKRWCSIVSDPQFAKLQFKVACEQKTLNHRLLFTRNDSEFESLDLETPWNGDKPSIRKLTAALEFAEWSRLHAEVLGSCNGLVSVATPNIWDPSTGVIQCYIWNPSTGFSHTLPVQV
ncbi:PREDICTED: F-box/kelch-repeat protein At3g06240-like [Fragaria vesca subsp. vesca]